MYVHLRNIQGFRGIHEYSIDDFINIINSKHNGVGKTTLYDCLRFLCDSKTIEKEEHQYFLNLKETTGEFSVTVGDVTHGFLVQFGGNPIFYRQYEGEEQEISSENIFGVAQDIGILMINGTIINIFSKELNLFSSSSAAKDYQLVKAVTTHAPTETVLDLLGSTLEYNKGEVSQLTHELSIAKAKVENVPYYLNLKEMESLLNDQTYENLEESLDRVKSGLIMMRPVKPLAVNSKFSRLLDVQTILERLRPAYRDVPKTKPLEELLRVQESVDRLRENTEYISAQSLDNIVRLGESIDKLEVADKISNASFQSLENLVNIQENLQRLRGTETISANIASLHTLLSIRDKVRSMINATRESKENTDKATKLKSGLQDVKVECPIRKEVYLVDGICHY